METHDCRISVVSQYQENPVPHPIRVDIWGVSCWNRAESEDLLTLFVAVEVFDAANRPQPVQFHEVVDAHEDQHGQGPARQIPDDPSVSNMIKPDTSSVSPMSLQLAIKSHIVATLSRARQPVMQGLQDDPMCPLRIVWPVLLLQQPSTDAEFFQSIPVGIVIKGLKEKRESDRESQNYEFPVWSHWKLRSLEPCVSCTPRSTPDYPHLGLEHQESRLGKPLAEENFMWDTNMLLIFKYTNTLHSNHIISIHCLPTAAFGNWFYFVCPDLQVATGCHCNQSAVALEVLLGLPWEWWQDKVRVFWCFLTGLHFVSCPLVN